MSDQPSGVRRPDESVSDPCPIVSVVIPAFNAARHIEVCVRSALAQRFKNLEVIVVDDGSEDDTLALVRRLQEADLRVRLLALETNSGRPAVPRNAGIAIARGEFVAFLDADDIWHPWKLSDQLAVMLDRPDFVFVYSIFETFGNVSRSDIRYGVKPLPIRTAVSRARLERENAIPCSSVLVRESFLRAEGGFDDDRELSAVEDYDLWLRLSLRGRIGFIPRIHGLYRAGHGGISDRTDMGLRLRHLLRKHSITLPPASRRPNLARRLFRALAHDAVSWGARLEEYVMRRGELTAIPVVQTGPTGRYELTIVRPAARTEN